MSSRGAIAAGLAVGIVFVSSFSFFSALPVCGTQYHQFSTEGWVRSNDIIVYGTVVSEEMRLAQAEYDYGAPGWSFGREAHALVTIRTDKYLQDRTHNHASFITFRDWSVHGCAYPFKSEIFPETRETVSYQIGDRSLFFIAIYDGDYEISGFVDKFEIVAEDVVQSKISREFEGEPLLLSELQAEIEKQGNMTTAEYRIT